MVTLILLLAVLLLLALPYVGIYLGGFRATNLNYTDEVTEGSFAFLTRDERDGTLLWRQQGKKAAVYCITYDPDSGVTEYTIPASCGDYPVEELGGYVGRGGPNPFGIDVQGLDCTTGVGLSDGSFDWYANPHHLEREYIDLDLNIGPNFREIFADQSGLDAGNKLVVVRVYVNCDPENPKFYSENGRLYTKRGELVAGLLYWDEDY